MRVDLLVEPRRSAFVDSDTEEVGTCTTGTRAVSVVMLPVSGTTSAWQGPSHASLSFVRRHEGKDLAVSGNPIAPKQEINAVVQQVPDE